MSDPFVQRMLARSQARRNVTSKLTSGNNKENSTINGNVNEMKTRNGISFTSPKKLQLESAYDEKIQYQNDAESSPKHVINNPLKEKSYNADKITQHLPTNAQHSSHTSPRKSGRSSRFQCLIQRAQEMEQWEDDYSYHSTSNKGINNKVEFSGSSLHAANACSKLLIDDVDGSKCKMNVQKAVTCDKKPKQYYFGESLSPSRPKPQDNTLYFTPQSPSESSYHSFSSSALNSPILKSPHLKASSPKKNNPLPPDSPTKRLAWDKELISSLEAQGFTPSTSGSKLSYDFQERDRSPLKDRNRSPVKQKLTANELSERPVSPSKVCDMKHVWEKHIRDASPERSPKAPSVPSPVRNRAISGPSLVAKGPKSPAKAGPSPTSPAKIKHQASHFQKNINSFCDNRLSVGKPSSDPANAASVPNTAVKIIHSQRKAGSPQKTNNPHNPNAPRALPTNQQGPPTKPLPGGGPNRPVKSLADVIKSTVAAPEATALVANPAASVRERAAAFSSLAGGKEPEKDPVEMSVQDRMGLFEKKKGAALVPKAPFGQCVSEKQIASQETPATSRSYEAPKTSRPVCDKTFTCSRPVGGPNSASAVTDNKRRFENLPDDWRASEINARVAEQRQRDMELLANRFKRPPPSSSSVPRETHAIPDRDDVDDSESDYPESEFSCESDAASIRSEVPATAPSGLPMGPPRPPRGLIGVVVNPPSPTGTAPSPSKIMNSTEVGECSPQSPRKAYVPKVKPGCLFPSLSDIESQSDVPLETDDDEDKPSDPKDSSFAESVLTCASGESLGVQIRRMAENARSVPDRYEETHVPHLTTISESHHENGMSASTLEAIGAIDDALDEAIGDYTAATEPSPSKRSRTDLGSSATQSEKAFRTPRLSTVAAQDSSGSDSSETNLAHSISMYRKQRPAEVTVTPVRPISNLLEVTSPQDSPVSPSVTIGSRIRYLFEQEDQQLKVISQASSAVGVVAQHPHQHGTTQHLEAEKLLLVATQKRTLIQHEIQRLKAEGALGKSNFLCPDEDSCRGSLSIGNVTLPLKQDFLNKLNESPTTHHFVVMLKHRDQLITSQLQSSPECVSNGAVTFPNLMALHDLAADFNIALEVYCLKVDSAQGHHIKKDHSRLKLTPLKRLHKSCANSPSVVSSPGGPFAVRSSSFQLIGFANLTINTLTRNAWTLEKVPFSSPVSGHLLMRVAVTMEGGVSHRSFLTAFDDVGGFGAWNRRWCVLDGPFIRYWTYPDDENRKENIGSFDLRLCTTRKVELVSRDVCARQHTFQLTFMRPAKKGDKDDLVREVRDNVLITRYLLAADGKEDRVVWCNKLNQALANVRAWDPDALKPEDYTV